MKLATLPMYDFPELRPATDAFWAAIAGRLPDAPAQLTREAACTDPDLLLGQTCGYPLMTALRGKVRLVATPRYRAAGCEGAFYRSAVMVRAAAPATGLAGLRGLRCAVNTADSNSGMNLLRAEIAPLAQGGRFFGEVIMTGSHASSVQAVASGQADVAAIDCVTWSHLQRLRPAETRGLRVLAWTRASPGLPLVTSLRTDAPTIHALVQALAEVALDPALAQVRNDLLLAGFEVLPAAAYEAVLDLERDAAAIGYAALR